MRGEEFVRPASLDERARGDEDLPVRKRRCQEKDSILTHTTYSFPPPPSFPLSISPGSMFDFSSFYAKMPSEVSDSPPLLPSENNLKFRTKMLRFHEYCKVTGLKPQDFSWPLLQGKVQRRFLCGSTFYNDEGNPSLDASAQYLLYIVRQRIFAAGGGIEAEDRISIMLLQRTMKYLTLHLNHMFDSAKSKKRGDQTLITAEEIEELMNRNEFRFYQYFRHFLPNPRPDAVYNNRFSRSLHNKYFHTPDGKDLYHSEKHRKIQVFRGQQCMKNVYRFYGPELTQKVLDSKDISFVKPDGRYSKFYAKLFHEACGLPPLDTEIIAVIDFIAVTYIDQMVYETILCRQMLYLRNIPFFDDYNDYLKVFQEDLFFHFICQDCNPLPTALFRPSLVFSPEVSDFYNYRKMQLKARKQKAALLQQRADFERKKKQREDPQLASFSLSGYLRERHL